MGIYFPATKSKIATFFPKFKTWLNSLSNAPTVMLGDFNTGINGLDNSTGTFTGSTHFAEICQERFCDAWRVLNGQITEYSWYSLAGNGFRIDHCLVTTDLAPNVVSAKYLHQARLDGFSDHSPLEIIIDEVQ